METFFFGLMDLWMNGFVVNKGLMDEWMSGCGECGDGASPWTSFIHCGFSRRGNRTPKGNQRQSVNQRITESLIHCNAERPKSRRTDSQFTDSLTASRGERGEMRTGE
jgi:hypothetical protein